MLMFINNMVLRAMEKLNDFIHDEEGDVNIVTIVVLIGIAVLLAIFFKDQIANLLETLFGTIENNATNALDESI